MSIALAGLSRSCRNKLVENQRQPINRGDELSNCLRREPRELLGAERVSNLRGLEPAEPQLADRWCSAQPSQRFGKQRFAASCHDQCKRQLVE